MSSIDVPESLSRDAEVISDTETPESNERICCELAWFRVEKLFKSQVTKTFLQINISVEFIAMCSRWKRKSFVKDS